MSPHGRCCFCGTELEELPGPAELDQSGETYLPARRAVCPKCPMAVEQTIATGEPYQQRRGSTWRD